MEDHAVLPDPGAVLRVVRDPHGAVEVPAGRRRADLRSAEGPGLLPESFQVLATPIAVVAGITYNFLPFTFLPLYVALERIDRQLVEAAKDLYASRFQAFRKVVLPLSFPGLVVALILTFVPATGDYVNSSVLGGTRRR